MTPSFFFRCLEENCRRQYDAEEKLYQCPECKGLLDLDYEFPAWDPKELKRIWKQRVGSTDPLNLSGVWRYREVLPINSSRHTLAVSLGEGNTPLLEAPQSARYAGLDGLKVKHLGWNPTGSFKDYGMTVATTQARILGSRMVACASTGNTSASMAAYAARAGLLAVVFIPEGQISFAKLGQSLDYGALTVQIEGDFDRAMSLVRELSSETDLYLMNSINPFRIEGQKTVVYELMEQLDWRVPDRIVLPGGNLGNVSAFGKALDEMRRLGLIGRLPRLTVVQAAGASPFHQMLRNGEQTLRSDPHASTRATAIKIGNPVSWKKASRAVTISRGCSEAVSEQELADAKAILGRDGIGCEPASATTLAGLKIMSASGESGSPGINPQEEVVAILTGHQLKDSEYTVDYHLEKLQDPAGGEIPSTFANSPIKVPADRDRIMQILARRHC